MSTPYPSADVTVALILALGAVGGGAAVGGAVGGAGGETSAGRSAVSLAQLAAGTAIK